MNLDNVYKRTLILLYVNEVMSKLSRKQKKKEEQMFIKLMIYIFLFDRFVLLTHSLDIR